ncbi:MAG: phosphohistidine phosphatase SixA [Pseudomonadales bacterium]|nr:histidine phosphatase family protein [Gammaproteobacteria bacterium]NNL56177.1 phosphohistidine phosphatase SixA [Pseudomonadales bacterium]
MHKLIVMRHGHAESFAASDRERVLTARGEAASRSQAALVANFFAGSSPAIYHSPFVRTTQTAAQLAAALSAVATGAALDCSRFAEPQLLGNNSPQAVLRWLDQSGIKQAVIISHQPLVSILLSLLIEGSTAAARQYPMSPASAALLEFECAGAGCFNLKALQHA